MRFRASENPVEGRQFRPACVWIDLPIAISPDSVAAGDYTYAIMIRSLAGTTVSPKPRWPRWLALGAASLLLHWLALAWLDGRLELFSPQQDVIFMETSLQTVSSSAPVTSPSKPMPPPRAKSARSKPPPPATVDTPPSTETLPNTTEAKAAEAGHDVSSVSAALASAAVPDTPLASASSNSNAKSANPRYTIALPPSVEMQYDIQALYKGDGVQGYGTIIWKNDGGHYKILGDVGLKIFFAKITYQTFESEGDVDAYGIAPLQYSEKRFRRAETATHFTRDRNLIVFSASQQTYPRQGGEQDRASVLWQLAGIARGDPSRFAQLTQMPVFVAGERDGEVWQIQNLGQEDIETGIGKMRAWHLARTPKAGSYDKRLDFWLAPEHEWYPVRLRYTEVNGDYLDMSASSIKPITSP